MSDFQFIDNQELLELANADGELKNYARFFTGSISFQCESSAIIVAFDNGAVNGSTPAASNHIEFASVPDIWAGLLAPKPPRLMTDLLPFVVLEQMTVNCDLTLIAQYYQLIMRLVELARPKPEQSIEDPLVEDTKTHGLFDAPTGQYIHLELGGVDHRIYFEEAGVGGIPLVLQHTAGAHGSQYRHLFENEKITNKFHLIAYDLPFHGKSMPPSEKAWWREEYKLRGDLVRELPVALSKALKLENPVFMGCSVGGMLALDLAYHNPDFFSAVISLEGALHVPEFDLSMFWHQQVNNEFKARVMEGTMSPTSPERYRKETAMVYASGWPPCFAGDIHYYCQDYDLRGKAESIDTNEVAVYILSGEYDMSGQTEMSLEAHQAIAGSKFIEMKGMGHFPMSENPAAFMQYIEPVLEEIASKR